MDFVTGISELEANLLKLQWSQRQKAKKAVTVAIRFLAQKMREEHPWKNQTGVTEQSITSELVTATITEAVGKIEAGNAAYFLELCHGQKWAWMWPILSRYPDEVLAIFLRYGALDAAADLSSLITEMRPEGGADTAAGE